jgi:hypothetical protein
MNGEPLSGPVTRLTRGGRHGWARSPWIALACFLIAAAVYKLAQLPVTSTTPTGIELELPGTADGALTVLRAFEDAGVLGRASDAISWDFLLILAYSLGLATLLEWLAGRDPDHRDALIGYAAWGALIAGACDVLEDAAMLVMLRSYPVPSAAFALTALFGTLVSLAKWTLLTAVVGYTSWEVAKSIGRAFFFPNPTAAASEPPVPKPNPGSTGLERRAEPAAVPEAQPATSKPPWLVDVFEEGEAEVEPEKQPAPQKVETT